LEYGKISIRDIGSFPGTNMNMMADLSTMHNG
jgi:hypothetical protein